MSIDAASSGSAAAWAVRYIGARHLKPRRVMSQRLRGKVTVVTGASKGIGAAIAKLLAAEGAAVVCDYATSREGAERVVGTIKSNGGRAIAVQADVTKPVDIKRLFTEAIRAFGKLDILVNNAGGYDFTPLDAI